ncbi:MAG: DUF2061 domain-containing protein [Flavobacterium sp.]|nr:DUF2061 domain-containing protein [Flavobacterium sp.]
MSDNSRKRHIAKAITWRIIGTIDTTLLSWFISGDPMIGLKVGLSEVVTKLVLYYFHERLWFNLNLSKDGKVLDSHKRHFAKSISWRFFGSLDTMLLAWLISGNPLIGFKIASFEVVTKIILYYLHERVWYKSRFGLSKTEKISL